MEFRQGDVGEELVALRRERRRFDFVYIDADKRSYKAYLNFLLGLNESGDIVNEEMLVDGALVVVDNVLWKGLVLRKVGAPYCTMISLLYMHFDLRSVYSGFRVKWLGSSTQFFHESSENGKDDRGHARLQCVCEGVVCPSCSCASPSRWSHCDALSFSEKRHRLF